MVAALKRSWAHRTWKREVAVILLLTWVACTLFLIFVSPLDRMSAAGGIYGVMTAAVFTFALGAFGLDALSKQLAQSAHLPPSLPTGGVVR